MLEDAGGATLWIPLPLGGPLPTGPAADREDGGDDPPTAVSKGYGEISAMREPCAIGRLWAVAGALLTTGAAAVELVAGTCMGGFRAAANPRPTVTFPTGSTTGEPESA